LGKFRVIPKTWLETGPTSASTARRPSSDEGTFRADSASKVCWPEIPPHFPPASPPMPRIFRSTLVLGLLSVAAISWGADTKDKNAIDTLEPPAATRDGLALRMKMPDKFAEGDRLKMSFKFTNVDPKRSFALYNKLFDSMYCDDQDFDRTAGIVVANRDTKDSYWVACEAEISRKASNFETVTLDPGKSWEGRFEFSRHLRFRSADRQKSLDSLPPGRYRMTVNWKFPPVANSKSPWWAGNIESLPVDFEITKAEAK
jgi:hypothetical protein